jgi:uncharacterized membrane protein
VVPAISNVLYSTCEALLHTGAMNHSAIHQQLLTFGGRMETIIRELKSLATKDITINIPEKLIGRFNVQLTIQVRTLTFTKLVNTNYLSCISRPIFSKHYQIPLLLLLQQIVTTLVFLLQLLLATQGTRYHLPIIYMLQKQYRKYGRSGMRA